ncbi:hypothetical protein MBSD_n1576 [Mizugakiibacter sediminis]|nr:hypothetical protein [Mizugakiibacter sediminis]GAP66272.1 hypothetical protein MBSD_n1576 [Mizugakiibacter sediminis]
MSTSIVLRYAGTAVEAGAMDVYAAAANMVAFSDFVVAAAHGVFGEQTEVRAEVRAFQRGSFATDLMFHLAGAAASVLATTSDTGRLLTTIKEALGLYRFLHGQAPAKVEHTSDRSVHVTNNTGQVITINIESLALTLNSRAGEAVQTFVAGALDRPGMESVSVSDAQGAPLASVQQGEASYYRRIDTDQLLLENVVRQALMIEMPSFKDGNKWRFWDGQNSVPIAIEDEAFLRRVDAGEPFRKGDVLIVDLRVTQIRSGPNLKTERTIVKVAEHKERVGDQLPLIG